MERPTRDPEFQTFCCVMKTDAFEAGSDIEERQGVGLAEITTTASSMHGCQMAIARFLDRMCLALRASGL